MKTSYSLLTVLAVAAALSLLVPTSAAAQCPQFVCYLDLDQGFFVCPNGDVYSDVRVDRLALDAFEDGCPSERTYAGLVEVEVPEGCSGVKVIVEYDDAPGGHTLNVGDSRTNDGFGGDGGTAPEGQNAEVHVFDEMLRIYNAADNPQDVETLVDAQLALTNSALKVVAMDQFVNWGNPFTSLNTPDLERLFFLPSDPVFPENRTIWVGVNRVIAPVGAPPGGRVGCGAKHAILFTQ